MTSFQYARANAPGSSTPGEADTVVRSLLLVTVFLLLWISFHPFERLDVPPEVTEAGNIVNQLGYSLLFLAVAGWCLAHQPQRLLLLVRPVLIALVIWFAVSVVTSWEPALSARRLAFMLVVMGIAAMALLLPLNFRQFAAVVGGVALFVLVVCYFGVFFLPTRAIHQQSDFLQTDLAGNWRGVFGEKNEASQAMAAFVFIGLFVARVRSAGLGALIFVLAAIFLYFTQSKTSLAILPLALGVSVLLTRIRRPAFGITLALAPVLILNLFSVGSVYFEPVQALLATVLSDTTFTGRTEIWQFAMEHLAQRPLTGYGFAAFWGTPEVVYGMDESAVWANNAAHAHNAYLNLALTIGIPGSALVTLWLVVLPLIDFYRSPPDPAAAPMKMLFLRVCLFAAYGSCFENMLLQEGALSLFLFMAAFGMRFLSVSRMVR